MQGPDNAIWDDGEWISWDDIIRQIEYKEWRAKYPNADLSMVPFFQDLLSIAEAYHLHTGNHLQVYGDIGELYGAITYGICLHENYREGSDGHLGVDLIEVKTITPFKKNNRVTVKMTGDFTKLLVVRINEDFEINARLIDRQDLPKVTGKVLFLDWAAALRPKGVNVTNGTQLEI